MSRVANEIVIDRVSATGLSVAGPGDMVGDVSDGNSAVVAVGSRLNDNAIPAADGGGGGAALQRIIAITKTLLRIGDTRE